MSISLLIPPTFSTFTQFTAPILIRLVSHMLYMAVNNADCTGIFVCLRPIQRNKLVTKKCVVLAYVLPCLLEFQMHKDY